MGRALLSALTLALAAASHAAAASPKSQSNAINDYIRPYVETHNFSGVILLAKRGQPVFARAYGFADVERRRVNTLTTRFHIASMSMQFTAAAALRLVNSERLSLDTPVSDVVVGYPKGDSITIRLVKGAYWDSDTVRYRQAGWPPPLFEHKAETDIHYERLIPVLFEQSDLIRPAFGTHNLRTLAAIEAHADGDGRIGDLIRG